MPKKIHFQLATLRGFTSSRNLLLRPHWLSGWRQYSEEGVPDDKLEMLMAELRAIELWDQLDGGAVPMNELDRIGGFQARRMRRLEIYR